VDVKHYYARLGQEETLVAFRAGGIIRYVATDHLGSTARVASGAFESVDHLTYTAFGAPRSGGTAAGTDRRYTGQIADLVSDLYWYRSRYYDANLGRFTQPDNVIPDGLNSQAWNRYAYVYNNPLSHADASGHAPDGVVGWVTGIVDRAKEWLTGLTGSVAAAFQARGFIDEGGGWTELGQELGAAAASETESNASQLFDAIAFGAGALTPRLSRSSPHAPSLNLGHTIDGVVRGGKGEGFHHISGKNGRMKADADVEQHGHGVYSANVEIKDENGKWVDKFGNRGRSTFFPDSWSEERIVREVQSAYANRHYENGADWHGVSVSGFNIEGKFRKANGVITTAYPSTVQPSVR
jgi:RHS repeat-associated protein